MKRTKADVSPARITDPVDLVVDAGIAESRAIGSQDAFLFRSYVRAVFVLIEGMSESLRRVAQEAPHLSAEARERASESVRAVKKAAKGNQPGFAVAVQVGMAAFAAAHACTNPLVASGPQWASFLKALAIRDRITHPKSASDPQVSDDDFKLVQTVHHWYQELDMKLMQAAQGS